jgi:hypothetical protein
MTEKLSTPEKPDIEKSLIEGLRTKGIEDVEVKDLLDKWTKREESKVPKTAEGPIEFNIKRARLYYSAGYIEEGIKVLEDALEQAWNEQTMDLYGQIVSLLDEWED